jgi:two-component system chemotaxis sensor kinase CheA
LSLCRHFTGEQQIIVAVKALPQYIKKVKGVAGCTLLGDGNISLILDIPDLMGSII